MSSPVFPLKAEAVQFRKDWKGAPQEWELTEDGILRATPAATAKKKRRKTQQRYALTADCEVSEVGSIDVKESRLYVFSTTWPMEVTPSSYSPRAAGGGGGNPNNNNANNVASSDGEFSDEEATSPATTPTSLSTPLHRRPSQQLSQQLSRKTGKGIATVGAAALAVGVGGVAIGALTFGVALVPYLAACGVAMGGGGALSRRKAKGSRRALLLGFTSLDAAELWRRAVATRVAARTAGGAASRGTANADAAVSRGFPRLGEPSRRTIRDLVRTSYFRGGVIRKWRDFDSDFDFDSDDFDGSSSSSLRGGQFSFAATRADVGAPAPKVLRALLGGEGHVLAHAGGILGRVEQVQSLDDTSDVALVATRPLAPAVGRLSFFFSNTNRHQKKRNDDDDDDDKAQALKDHHHHHRKKSSSSSASLLLVAWAAFEACARYFVAVCTSLTSFDATTRRRLRSRALWLSWAFLAALARRVATVAPNLKAARWAARATHVRPRLFRVRRAWRVVEDTGECLLELRSDPASADRLDAVFSVTPSSSSSSSSSRGGGDDDGEQGCVISAAMGVSLKSFSSSSTSSSSRKKKKKKKARGGEDLCFWPCPGALETFRESVASLFVDELVASVFDLKEAIERQRGGRPRCRSAVFSRTVEEAPKGPVVVEDEEVFFSSLSERIRLCRDRIANGEANVANAADPDERRRLVRALSVDLAELRRLTGPDGANVPVFEDDGDDDTQQRKNKTTTETDGVRRRRGKGAPPLSSSSSSSSSSSAKEKKKKSGPPPPPPPQEEEEEGGPDLPRRDLWRLVPATKDLSPPASSGRRSPARQRGGAPVHPAVDAFVTLAAIAAVYVLITRIAG